MVMVGVHVAQKNRGTIHAVDDYVDLAIVKEVSERCTAAHGDDSQSRSLNRRHKLKFAVPKIVIK